MSTDENAQPIAEPASPPEPVVAPAPAPVSKPKKQASGSPLSRVWQGFWRGNVRELEAKLDPARQELLRRARTAAEIARRTASSSEPFPGSAEPVLCDLYRQSIHWSLCALYGEGVPVDSAALLSAAGKDPEAAERVARAVVNASFADFSRLPVSERAQLQPELRRVAEGLIAELAVPEQVVLALWAQRILRVGLLVVLLLLIALVALKVRDGSEEARDIAAGKPWRLSSQSTACHSPAQECADFPDYFFHTQQEANPWVEIDLGSPQRFSGIRIENRKDCCTERASPLVFESSLDQKTWKVLARREGTFETWRASVPPITARWVRVRIDSNQAILHLSHVRVLR